ncbi:DNA-binding response regulator [Mobiluncus mulieris]|uniref:DNA-binding response regulator n=1 Tax=Mobiluncus mulieris TaxID=2052 RepID=UPI00242F2666|nr:DNA-binding response regulator [Mobiluncus mulieris]
MDAKTKPDAAEIMIFSSDLHTRETIMDAAGISGAFGLPPINWLEVATAKAAKLSFEENRFAALVLDAETTQEGGESLSRWLHDHHDKVPPVIMLVARPQDEWLARWSGAAQCIQAPFHADTVVDAIQKVLAPAH